MTRLYIIYFSDYYMFFVKKYSYSFLDNSLGIYIDSQNFVIYSKFLVTFHHLVFSKVLPFSKINRLVHWLNNEKGEINGNLEIKNGPHGRGIFAKEKVKQGSTLLSIKPDAILSSQYAVKHFYDKIPTGSVRLDCIDILSLFLVLERK